MAMATATPLPHRDEVLFVVSETPILEGHGARTFNDRAGFPQIEAVFLQVPGAFLRIAGVTHDCIVCMFVCMYVKRPARARRNPRRGAAQGHGKRGGARVIYFLRKGNGEIMLLSVYAKSCQGNLSRAFLRELQESVHEE